MRWIGDFHDRQRRVWQHRVQQQRVRHGWRGAERVKLRRDRGMGQGGGGGAAEQFCNSVGPALCDAVFACCTDPTKLAELGGTAAACKSMLAGTACLSNFGAQLEGSLASGQTVVDKMQIDACVTRLKSMSGGGAACVEPPVRLVLTDCFTAFRGQVPTDAACTWTPETNSYAQCKDGLCKNAKCVAFLKTGATCDPSAGATSLCNFTRGESCKATGATGTCGPRGELGAACGSKGMMSAECRSWNCGQDGKCAAPTQASQCPGG